MTGSHGMTSRQRPGSCCLEEDAVFQAGVPVDLFQLAVAAFQRLASFGGELGQRLVDGDVPRRPAEGVFALFQLFQVVLEGGAVLGLVAEVADDDVVQGGDGLAEVERVGQRADVADAVAAQVRLQRQGHAARPTHDAAATAVGHGEVHGRQPSRRVGDENGGIRPVSTSRRGPGTFTEPARRTCWADRRLSQPAQQVRRAGKKNNGPGDAYAGRRNRGGTPRQGSLECRTSASGKECTNRRDVMQTSKTATSAPLRVAAINRPERKVPDHCRVPCFRGRFPYEQTIPPTAKACLTVSRSG